MASLVYAYVREYEYMIRASLGRPSVRTYELYKI